MTTASVRAVDTVAALLDRVQTYLDALYDGDVALFETVMHPTVRLHSATQPELVSLSLQDYLEIVAGRVSPHSRGDRRRDRVLAVTMSSPTSAHVRVENAYPPKLFADDLVFTRTDGQWWITSKTWHYTIEG
ncbi:MAG: nuclear transport factor 2 family protein [Mycobacterium sp.]